MGSKTERLPNLSTFNPDLYEEGLDEGYARNLKHSRKDYLREVEAKGMKVYVPDRDELLIDIDTKVHAQQYANAFMLLNNYIEGIEVRKITRSENGGWHVYIKMPFNMSSYERIAWQAALGSDPMRELLSLIRIKQDIEDPILLVEKE